ncbi:MAG: ABC transporter permease [Gemmatimonadetes bacterium]|nr:ABC transporter permease [Gemmatimonadota bacterium]
MTLAWRLEWSAALARRRLLLLNVCIPLLLVAPVALAGAPAHHAAAVYAVLFVLFGTFGSAIPLVRDAESGLVARLHLAGQPGAALLLGRASAGAALDGAELAPALALALIVGGGGPGEAAAALAALLAALLLANLVGVWVAAAARSLAEAALFASVAALLLLHAGGAFRSPAPGSVAAAVETAVPFRLLHETLLAASGSAPPPGPAAWWVGAAALATAVAGTAAAAPRLARILARAPFG